MISPFPKGTAPTVTAFIASLRKASGHDGPSSCVSTRPARRAHQMPSMLESGDEGNLTRPAGGQESSQSNTLLASHLNSHKADPFLVTGGWLCLPQPQRISISLAPHRKVPMYGEDRLTPPDALLDIWPGQPAEAHSAGFAFGRVVRTTPPAPHTLFSQRPS